MLIGELLPLNPPAKEVFLGTRLDAAFLDQFFERLLAAARSRDPKRVADLCTKDIVFDDAGNQRPLQGREALIELLGGIYGLVTNLELDIEDLYLSTDATKAGARWHATGVLKHPAGKRIEFDSAEFYEFRDGLISHWIFMARDPDWLGRQWGS